VKGGRLAALLHPAQSISIVLSDVVGDELSSIASGPTVPDESTYAQAREIVTRYGAADALPASVAAVLEDGAAGKIGDTPGGGDPVFASARTAVVGSNIQALRAASRAAEEAGFRTLLLSSRVEGEAREIAHFYTALAADAELMARDGRPLCIIAGGETTVTVRGEGAGGRNQEMAAAALLEMSRHPDWFERRLFMAASTDGNDGPTDAAGGFADLAALQQLAPTYREGQAELRDALSRNDSYELLSRAGALVKTGPTGTNVCDIQIVLYGGNR
jgi:hydroxypyruvate reductase